MDTERTRARTSLRPGSGTGASAMSSTFGSRTTRACIVCVIRHLVPSVAIDYRSEAPGWRCVKVLLVARTCRFSVIDLLEISEGGHNRQRWGLPRRGLPEQLDNPYYR